MNGLKQTHSLPLMILQQGQSNTSLFELGIPRIKKQDTKNAELSDIQQVVCIGTLKPSMPNNDSFKIRQKCWYFLQRPQHNLFLFD